MGKGKCPYLARPVASQGMSGTQNLISREIPGKPKTVLYETLIIKGVTYIILIQAKIPLHCLYDYFSSKLIPDHALFPVTDFGVGLHGFAN